MATTNQALTSKSPASTSTPQPAAAKTVKVVSQIPKLPEAKTFTQAVANYSTALSGVDPLTISSQDVSKLNAIAKKIRDFDSKSLSENAKGIIRRSSDAVDAINAIQAQKVVAKNAGLAAKNWWERGAQGQAEKGKSQVERDKLERLKLEATQNKSKYIESLSRFGLEDIASGIGTKKKDVENISKAVSELSAGKVVGTGGLDSRLNIQVSDAQILDDVNTARKNNFKSLYDNGNAVITDLQSQISVGKSFLADLGKNDSRRAAAQKQVDDLRSQLATAQADTLKAKNAYEKYTPLSGTQATTAISQFREKLRLPEERTLAQIDVIDPTVGATVRALSTQYKTMAETPLGPTTTAQTEDLRNRIEQEAINQLKLGSTLGEEERRQYEQATRAAQTARGNVFGLGPAVQEAANIGAAAEQRKLARYGAAASFLGSGETTGAATARDLGLRNALEQSRLGAAQGFISSGPTMYNLASQRLGTQQNMLNNYLAASQPQQTGQFQGVSSAANPYGYVNPNAGFVGAQNAASIYNTLADYASQTYGAQVGAISRQPSGAEQFGQIATGLGNLIKI
jgi:hypothetical protein